MLETKIKTCATHNLTIHDWNSYVSSFNVSFDKDFDLKHFKHKYYSSCDGHSYHSFLLDENENVVGACTVIPYIYKRSDVQFKLAVAVDLFILPEYRGDSLIFLKLYLNLKKVILNTGIIAVVAVPNSNSYLYWKKVIKFKDVGNLSYWAIPIKIANIRGYTPALNYFSSLFTKINYQLNHLASRFFNSVEQKALYEIGFEEKFLKARFLEGYQHIIDNNISCYYKIVDEEGTKTAYLLYAKENRATSYKALLRGVQMIMRKEEVDLILFVGTLRVFQFLFIRVPVRLEPKTLPLICDIIRKEDREKYKDIYDLKNWNFGLINYDVR